MTLSEITHQLPLLNKLRFELPDGSLVPIHFHVTEVGVISKDYIDCGGTIRHEKVINFQLWEADDYDHRLAPKKLLEIIQLSQKAFDMPDLQIEVEYQETTIGKYGLDFNGEHFLLTPKQTDCLAKDKCGIPQAKPKIRLSELIAKNNSCEPGSGCC